MDRTEHLLTCATEECAEVAQVAAEVARMAARAAQRAAKALRFGMDEIQPGQTLTNSERIAAEVIDLLAVLEMLGFDVGALLADREAIDRKKAKVEKFLSYSGECGTLAD